MRYFSGMAVAVPAIASAMAIRDVVDDGFILIYCMVFLYVNILWFADNELVKQ